MEIPTKIVKVSSKDPRKLLIYGNPKIGKTSALAQLPNNLIIDLEGGSEFVDAIKLNIKKLAEESNSSKLAILKEAVDKIKAMDHKYTYVTIDSATALEDIANYLACNLYKATPMGKAWTGTDITPFGS